MGVHLHINMTFDSTTHTATDMSCELNWEFAMEYLYAAIDKEYDTPMKHHIGLWYRYPCSTPAQKNYDLDGYTVPRGSKWRYTVDTWSSFVSNGECVLGAFDTPKICSCVCRCRCQCSASYSDWRECSCCAGECLHPCYEEFTLNFRQTSGMITAVDKKIGAEIVLALPTKYIPGDEAYVEALANITRRHEAAQKVQTLAVDFLYRPGGGIFNRAMANYYQAVTA